MERYERILTLFGILYQENCPVIFEKGALLKDKKFDKNILQLRFRSISRNKIKAVFVCVACLDIEKNIVETVVQKYIDLNVNYYDTFGDSVAIQLSDNMSRTFEITVQKVIFLDDSASELSGKMVNFEDGKSLDELGNLKSQFTREVQKRDSSIPISDISYPVEYQGLWRCACGSINSADNIKCGRCKAELEKSYKLLDKKFLYEKNAEHLKQLEAENEARKLFEEQLAEKERKIHRKRIKELSIVAVVILIIAIFWGVVTFIVPNVKYLSAINCIKTASYDTAYRLLEELGDYKDSYDQLLVCKYKQGIACIDNKEYEKGYELLESLGDYSDAADQIIKGYYKEAVDCLENADYEKAIRLFQKNRDYADSEEKIKEATYQYAIYFMDTKQYDLAIKELEKIPDYSDSRELRKECYYYYADNCLEHNKYKEAIYYYNRSDHFNDADEKILETMYQYSVAHMTSNDDRTVQYLNELSKKDYKDAKELKEKLYR